MAITARQKSILIGIGAGIVIGVLVGGIGGYFGLPAGVRGGLTGMLIVPVFFYLRKQMAAGGDREG